MFSFVLESFCSKCVISRYEVTFRRNSMWGQWGKLRSKREPSFSIHSTLHSLCICVCGVKLWNNLDEGTKLCINTTTNNHLWTAIKDWIGYVVLYFIWIFFSFCNFYCAPFLIKEERFYACSCLFMCFMMYILYKTVYLCVCRGQCHTLYFSQPLLKLAHSIYIQYVCV